VVVNGTAFRLPGFVLSRSAEKQALQLLEVLCNQGMTVAVTDLGDTSITSSPRWGWPGSD